LEEDQHLFRRTAQISAEGVPGDQSEGRIEEIAPELNENPFEPGPARFRAVELSFSKNERRFLIGQTVAVKLLGCGS
jgi:hypothetical protein